MKLKTIGWLGCSLVLALSGTASADWLFDPQVGQPGSLAIARDDSRIVGWATGYRDLIRGPVNLANPSGPLASVGSGSDALGASNNRVVSLGDGGQITLTFDRAIRNGAGADFVVFENGFLAGNQGLAFLELGFVEVSSNGEDFFRFPSISLTQTETQVGPFGSLDARNIHNLAGKHVGGYGTPFDLSDLVGVSPLLDVNAVRFVRIIDVVGSIDPLLGSRDSRGNLINDPFATPFASGGFDLDAVGVLHFIPEPASLAMVVMGLAAAAGVARSRRRRAG